jgi:hypothetical protein
LFGPGAEPLLFQSLFAAWILAGVWCALMAFTRARRLRALVAVALGAFLLIQSTSIHSGLTLLSYPLGGMLCLIGLGAGLWLTRDAPTRGLGRLVAGGSALLFIWTMATGVGTSELETYLQEMGALLQTGAPESAVDHYLWLTLVPQTLLLLGALTGLFALLGLTARLCLTVSFYLVLAGLLMPAIVGMFLPSNLGMWGALVEAFVARGIPLWVLGVFALTDLGRMERQAA